VADNLSAFSGKEEFSFFPKKEKEEGEKKSDFHLAEGERRRKENSRQPQGKSDRTSRKGRRCVLKRLPAVFLKKLG